jgi:hypothetical protein
LISGSGFYDGLGNSSGSIGLEELGFSSISGSRLIFREVSIVEFRVNLLSSSR